MEKRSRPWKIADARATLNAQVASGLSIEAFAKREGLDSDRLYRWRRRLAVENNTRVALPTPALIEVRSPARRAELVEIVLASGVTLRVTEAIDPAALARLVVALR